MTEFALTMTAFALGDLLPDGLPQPFDLDLEQEDADSVECGSMLETAVPGRW